MPASRLRSDRPVVLRVAVTTFLLASLLARPSPGASPPASDVAGAVTERTVVNERSRTTQERIAAVDDETQRLVGRYRQLTREVAGLRRYNEHLERMVASQDRRRDRLAEQTAALETTRRDVVPLIERMIDVLHDVVAGDPPFLPDERRQRLAGLQSLRHDSAVSLAERYRRVLEAYQAEASYGRDIEAYRSELDLGGSRRTVDFLRIGRIGLYYQTLDGTETGRWDRRVGGWRRLDDGHRHHVRTALRVARKELSPILLVLPLDGPERTERK